MFVINFCLISLTIIRFIDLCLNIIDFFDSNNDEPPELTEEMRIRLYS